MNARPAAVRGLWRVGHHQNPLAFAPPEVYEFSHRFDDLHRRFRTLYFAQRPETCLREVLADFRPNMAARQRHVERYGAEAADDFAAETVTARWRSQHVLAPVRLELDGQLVDLTDVPTRQAIEDRHRALLVEHRLEHLDLHEITTPRRAITQTVAAELFDHGAAAVRFPSRLDGEACVALFEGRGQIFLTAGLVALTDPAPQALTNVAAPWRLKLEPAVPARTPPDERSGIGRP